MVTLSDRKYAVRQFMIIGLMLVFALSVLALRAMPAQAATDAQNRPIGFRLMWANRTAMRLRWSASRGARSYAYRLYQMDGMQVRSGQKPSQCRTVAFAGLHSGWRYRSVVWSVPADRPGPRATLYVTLPGSAPPREDAYRWAESQAGTPYVWGGEGRRGYDCSGLVQSAYLHVGIWLPRTTGAMLRDRKLEREALPRQGDLVFFGSGHVELDDTRVSSFGAESGNTRARAGASWYRWWPHNWWPTAFYRVRGAG
jgi:hypothetical protein